MNRTKPSDPGGHGNGLRSVEALHHFNCAECSKWWSIGDAPPARSRWFCPWCGCEQSFVEPEEIEIQPGKCNQ